MKPLMNRNPRNFIKSIRKPKPMGQPQQPQSPAQPSQAPVQQPPQQSTQAQPAQPPQAPAQPAQPPQAQQPKQNVFERRASGANPVSNVINFASQNRGAAQQQAQMQAQQQQAQFLQQATQKQQAPQPQQQPQQMTQPMAQQGQPDLQQQNRFSNLQQKMEQGQEQPQQMQEQPQQAQEEMPVEQELSMPQMPKMNAYGQAQGLAGQAAGLTGTAAGLAKLAGAGELAGKLGGAAGGIGAAAQGLGAFNALAGGDRVGGVDQLAGMAANFIPGVGPLGGAAYNMIPEGIRKSLIGGGLKVADRLGLDKNALNVNQPGKMAEGLAKTGLNVVTGGKVGQAVGKEAGKVLKSVTKSLPKISAPKIKVCHLAGTPVKMADGSIKNIEDIKLGESIALGGMVLARGEALQGEQVYDYNGIFVTGSHAVCENGNWLRVEDSQYSVPVSVDGLVYPMATENNLIVTADNQVWADMNEVEDTYDLTDTQIIDILNSQDQRNAFLREYMDADNKEVQGDRLSFTSKVVF